MVGEVFGFPAGDPVTAEIRPIVDDFKNYFANHNQAGGKSFFLPQPDIKLVSTVLKEAVPVADVDIQQTPTWPVKMGPAYDGALTYIHKVKDGRDIYFFANSLDTPVDTKVVLRARRAWRCGTRTRRAAEGRGDPGGDRRPTGDHGAPGSGAGHGCVLREGVGGAGGGTPDADLVAVSFCSGQPTGGKIAGVTMRRASFGTHCPFGECRGDVRAECGWPALP